MTISVEDAVASLLARKHRELSEHAARAQWLRAELSREMGRWIESGAVQRAWLIGSLLYGTFGAESDVDVVVEGLASDREAELWSRLMTVLDSEVDLLRMETLQPGFRDRVLAEGRSLP